MRQIYKEPNEGIGLLRIYSNVSRHISVYGYLNRIN